MAKDPLYLTGLALFAFSNFRARFGLQPARRLPS
jgi:hypothetical protein